jgi:diguanylate cyclase (GGDEF)-like protein
MKSHGFPRLWQRIGVRALVVWTFLLGILGAATEELIGKWLEEPLAATGHVARNWLTASYRISLAVDSNNPVPGQPFSTASLTGWVILLIFLALASGAALLGWLLYRLIRGLKDELNRDPTTDTFSPRGLRLAFNQWDTTTWPEQPSVMVLLDLVGFRKFNEKFGQAGGDKVLAAVGRFLRGETKAKEVIGRYGGDEFLLLMRGHENAILGALRARQRDLNPCAVFEVGTNIMVPFRAGVTTFTDESFDSAYKKASDALRASKLVPEDRIKVEEVATYVTTWTENLSYQMQAAHTPRPA